MNQLRGPHERVQEWFAGIITSVENGREEVDNHGLPFLIRHTKLSSIIVILNWKGSFFVLSSKLSSLVNIVFQCTS